MDVSIIIRVKNEGESLEKLLNIIENQNKENINVEVVTVYSESSDNTLEVATKHNCKIVEITTEDFSWGKALNRGIENANGELCIFLSAHCYPNSKLWLLNLIKPLLQNENVGATYGRQLPLQNVDIFEEVELAEWFPENIDDAKERVFSDANTCIRKTVWNTIKFDETLNSCEDGEWAMRIKKANYRIFYVPESCVYHSHKMKVDTIYRRWYWRSRVVLNIRKNDQYIITIASKFPIPTMTAMGVSCFHYFLWFFKDLKYCIKKGYIGQIWKIAPYEIIRNYSIYRGIKDGLNDIRKNRCVSKFTYFKNEIPSLIKMLKFIE